MKLLRSLAGLLVVALAGWLVVSLSRSGAPAQPAAAFTSSMQCRECHAVQYAEWESSWHARAWTDEDVRALSFDFANKDCIDCHAPRPVFETGIGNRVLPRSFRQTEGVDCISCHLLPEGGVAGTMASARAACRPVERRELVTAEFCAVCHDQHKTVEQWRATPYAAQGIGCIDCHMKPRDGTAGAGRDHRCLGGHDEELVRSAVVLRGMRSGEGWRVEVENVAAGHYFPTDERSRAADVFWRPVADGASAGEGAWRHLYRFRDPYRTEVDLTSTLLAHGETREIPLADADARGAVEVALFYRLTPYYTNPETGEPVPTETVGDPESQALLLHRIVLQP